MSHHGVIGGVATVLFGLIAVTGARIWVENGVDFSRGINLFIAGTMLIMGAADYTLSLGSFALGGIGVGTFGVIILYQVFKRAENRIEESTEMSEGEEQSSSTTPRGPGS